MQVQAICSGLEKKDIPLRKALFDPIEKKRDEVRMLFRKALKMRSVPKVIESFILMPDTTRNFASLLRIGGSVNMGFRKLPAEAVNTEESLGKRVTAQRGDGEQLNSPV